MDRDGGAGRRDADARHPDVLAARRKEGARTPGGKGTRWGGRHLTTAARRVLAPQPERQEAAPSIT
ncbi:hypothetical protein [Streptomyces sp. NPDC014734]|uniref:hypothetical protein n=1 Tax=Streptomyces sp. NPDC014734 TaxID=3364886 RepID=UPI0036F709B8